MPRFRPPAKEALGTELASLDPLELLHQIWEGQAALAALGTGQLSQGPERESLEAFLAKLPGLWHEGEARPTHRSETPARVGGGPERILRAVWPEILLWLQQVPELTAKSLLERLQREYPASSPRGNCVPCSAAVRMASGHGPDTGPRLPGWEEATGNPVVVEPSGTDDAGVDPLHATSGGLAARREPRHRGRIPGADVGNTGW